MAYSEDLKRAADRHWAAAERLRAGAQAENKRDRGVRGYLYGIAAECALKALMRAGGMRPAAERKDDPFYAHFPALRTLLKDNASGRHQSDLYKYARDDSFMNEWAIEMRYGPNADVTERLEGNWREHADRVLGTMREVF